MSFEEHKMIRLMCWERKNLFVFDKGEKKKTFQKSCPFITIRLMYWREKKNLLEKIRLEDFHVAFGRGELHYF